MAKRTTNANGTPPTIEIRVGDLVRHPANRTPVPGEITTLTASIEAHGQLTAAIVRKHPRLTGKYQVLAGERRRRACEEAKKLTMRCELIAADDARALQIVAIENGQREGVNAIDEAKLVDQLTASLDNGGAGLTQRQAAELFGHTQSWAANRLRLLKLPEDIQRRVAAGELEETYALAMVPYAKIPGLGDALLEDIKENPEEWVTRDDIAPNVSDLVQDITRPMDPAAGVVYSEHSCRNESIAFNPTDEQLEELGVVKVPLVRRWGDQPNPKLLISVATNRKLWDDLQKATIKKRKDNGAKGKTTAEKVAATVGAAPPENATPAKKKAHQKRVAAERAKLDKQRAAEQAKRHKEAVAKWRVIFVRWAIAQKIDGMRTDVTIAPVAVMRWFLYFATGGDYGKAGEYLATATQTITGGKSGGFRPTWSNIWRASADQVANVTDRFVCEFLLDPSDRSNVGGNHFEPFLDELGVELKTAWADLQKTKDGTRGRHIYVAWWNLQTKDQLGRLGDELQVNLHGADTKPARVKKFLIAGARVLPLPKLLAPHRKSTRKAKTTKKRTPAKEK